VVERFNHGIISDIGHRDHQEDSYRSVSQLFNLDNRVQISYFAVFDGHGGEECAIYCSENLHVELRSQLEDVLTGIEHSNDLNKSIKECFENSFRSIDKKFAQLYPSQCK